MKLCDEKSPGNFQATSVLQYNSLQNMGRQTRNSHDNFQRLRKFFARPIRVSLPVPEDHDAADGQMV